VVKAAEAQPGVDARIDPVILRVKDVVKHFPIGGVGGDVVRAVDGVSFEIRRGETLGLVGESGSGKSTLGRVLTALHPATSGSVIFEGQDLTKLKGNKLRQMRRQLQIIFQDPFASLDPRMRVRDIVAEGLVIHGMGDRSDRSERVARILARVGLRPEAGSHFPHEFSGGQRQRIAIARALAVEPKLIICDEPVSALDVSIRSQILNLLRDLQDRLGLAYIFVSHDLAVVRTISDSVVVLESGHVREANATEPVFTAPAAIYTRALLDAIPDLRPDDYPTEAASARG